MSNRRLSKHLSDLQWRVLRCLATAPSPLTREQIMLRLNVRRFQAKTVGVLTDYSYATCVDGAYLVTEAGINRTKGVK